MHIRNLTRPLISIVVFMSILTLGAAKTDTTRHRVGAACNDGTQSKATGSGACSHHHGVKCWEYSDGSCTKP
jgi:hypothetical protein